MPNSHYCEEKREIALINSEDPNASAKHRAEMAKAAQMWGELSDRWLELELRQGLLPGGALKRG